MFRICSLLLLVLFAMPTFAEKLDGGEDVSRACDGASRGITLECVENTCAPVGQEVGPVLVVDGLDDDRDELLVYFGEGDDKNSVKEMVGICFSPNKDLSQAVGLWVAVGNFDGPMTEWELIRPGQEVITLKWKSEKKSVGISRAASKVDVTGMEDMSADVSMLFHKPDERKAYQQKHKKSVLLSDAKNGDLFIISKEDCAKFIGKSNVVYSPGFLKDGGLMYEFAYDLNLENAQACFASYYDNKWAVFVSDCAPGYVGFVNFKDDVLAGYYREPGKAYGQRCLSMAQVRNACRGSNGENGVFRQAGALFKCECNEGFVRKVSESGIQCVEKRSLIEPTQIFNKPGGALQKKPEIAL